MHVTSTPDLISCQDHFRFLMTGLGLRRDTALVHHNLGCAGLAAGFRTAAASLISMVPATALVVASNCPSGYFGPEVHDAYYGHPSGMGWLAPLMFADGAGAVVFRSAPHDPGDRPKGCCRSAMRPTPTSGSSRIPRAAACTTPRQRTCLTTSSMDGVKVAEVFPALMARDFQMLQEDWPVTVKPLTGDGRSTIGIRSALVPAPGQRRGGTPGRPDAGLAARTGSGRCQPLREHLGRQHADPAGRGAGHRLAAPRVGRVRDGDLVAFLWIGAGNGAMNGYAAMVL